ncbi:MAG TPA: histidinol-phosphate transaminase [Candidatus Binataceae bacterium]|jgi:histidinol-phosphate aminotransferase|nr:histidinol-phosphate transaminase [Candidatus Binataceae bacterium]
MFRKAIHKMAPYVPGEQPRPGQRLVKLNTNENPYPPSPRVIKAVANAALGQALRLYPAPQADAFIAAAARRYGFAERMIVAGNGSDELLAMLFRATLGPGDRVAWATPTYSLYDTLAAVQEARVIAPPFGPDFELPLEALARARARLTIVCNPNSPSGTLTPRRTLARLARLLDGRLLAIDEAYVDFAENNALDLVQRLPNVLVLRSLSKSYSLAGMRLGLCFAHPEIIEQLGKVKDSYNLSRLAIAAGAAALDDNAWMLRNVERIKRTRAAATRRLLKMGFAVPPSSANFVLARMPGRDLGPMAAGLRKRDVLVRHFRAWPDAIRISIGTPAEMAALFEALAPLAAALMASWSNGRARS